MNTLTTTLEVAQLVVVGGMALLGWRYLPTYIAKKAEHLATKEDIAEITSRVEQARFPFAEALERLSGELQRESSRLTARQELYVQFAEAAATVFLSGRKTTDEDARRFLAMYAATFLHAPDDVLTSVTAHLDVQLQVAALPPERRATLQPALRSTLADLMVALRKEAFYPSTAIDRDAFRFISFG